MKYGEANMLVMSLDMAYTNKRISEENLKKFKDYGSLAFEKANEYLSKANKHVKEVKNLIYNNSKQVTEKELLPENLDENYNSLVSKLAD